MLTLKTLRLYACVFFTSCQYVVCFGLFVIVFIVGIDRVDVASCLRAHFNDGAPWLQTGANGGQWELMGANGGQWEPMETRGPTGTNEGQREPTVGPLNK